VPQNHADTHVENRTHKSVKPKENINKSQVIKKTTKVENKPLEARYDILNRENVP
jgi:hypothetical protein